MALATMTLWACSSQQPEPAKATPNHVKESPGTESVDIRKKRFRQLPEVEPVVHRGIRYEALHWGKERGLGQNGGYVVTIDASTEREIGLWKIYSVAYDRGLEGDKLDVFITRLEIDASGNHLIVDDERDRRFFVDLTTREVSRP